MLKNNDKILKTIKANLNSHITGIDIGIRFKSKDYFFSYGDFEDKKQYFIASTTKLFTVAIIFQLIEEGVLQLNTPIVTILGNSNLFEKLNYFNEKDWSSEILLKDLLNHSSGIPDYFQGTDISGHSLVSDLLNKKDKSWSAEDAIVISKKINSTFAPHSGKALYSDTNFQILKLIIEKIDQRSFTESVNVRIKLALSLKNTFLFELGSDLTNCVPMKYKNNELIIPKAMASTTSDGGIVSTSQDLLIFVNAFFKGQLFSKLQIAYPNDQIYPVMFPLKYGTGYMLIRLPRWMTLFKKFPDLIGHSGLSGAFAFYSPDYDFSIVGTVNQLDRPDTSFRLILKIADLLVKEI